MVIFNVGIKCILIRYCCVLSVPVLGLYVDIYKTTQVQQLNEGLMKEI